VAGISIARTAIVHSMQIPEPIVVTTVGIISAQQTNPVPD